jgi:UDP-2-acetamido-2-deoxy-ribo-hexuluronate aminotransferase
LGNNKNMEPIVALDLASQRNRIAADLDDRIARVLTHHRYILGPEVTELENQLAERAGTKHAVSCSSGTDALLLALMAQSIGPGDAIFTTPFTFVATAEVVELLGATPVFVDIDLESFNISSEALAAQIDRVVKEDKLTPRGIIAVDLFGLPANYKEINSVAARHELFVIADAAQSFGGTLNNKPVGSLAGISATSFFPAKPLGCYGDGGAVFTDDDDIANAFTSIRMHGKGTDKYDNVRHGLNARLDTLQAAVLLAKLPIFDDEIAARNRIANAYTDGLHNVVTTPNVPDNAVSAWAQYSILVNDRDQVAATLKEAGVPTAIYYPKPLHLQTAYASHGHSLGDFPVSESTSDRILSLPVQPYLDDEQVSYIIDSVHSACALSKATS